ncbi:UrcA family protein [uncultured Brevundimonas sp.]|uniref:UrcA family protein n=1 Tax=uncultured Brevundimonas sp. TaxID=213418 RepID=UPI0030EF80B5|tara:strand:+ start:59734 stop:60036 length:303 start_codon:yes stop_codon:yes gene_type:complete
MQKFVFALCVALAAAGSAAAQESHRVRIGDLDLSTAHGAAAFDARVRRVARSACSGRSPMNNLQCRAILAQEFRDALPDSRRAEYVQVRSVNDRPARAVI